MSSKIVCQRAVAPHRFISYPTVSSRRGIQTSCNPILFLQISSATRANTMAEKTIIRTIRLPQQPNSIYRVQIACPVRTHCRLSEAGVSRRRRPAITSAFYAKHFPQCLPASFPTDIYWANSLSLRPWEPNVLENTLAIPIEMQVWHRVLNNELILLLYKSFVPFSPEYIFLSLSHISVPTVLRPRFFKRSLIYQGKHPTVSQYADGGIRWCLLSAGYFRPQSWGINCANAKSHIPLNTGNSCVYAMTGTSVCSLFSSPSPVFPPQKEYIQDIGSYCFSIPCGLK